MTKKAMMGTNTPKLLNLFTWGNPSRGDDAIGPVLHQIIAQFIEQYSLTQIQLIEDFQLQPEHICDINSDACIIFIDARCEGDDAYQITSVHATENIGYSSHALSPSALLTLYQHTQNVPSPPAFMISVRGYAFDLGEPLSKQAAANIELVTPFLKALLTSQYPMQLLQNALTNHSTATHTKEKHGA